MTEKPDFYSERLSVNSDLQLAMAGNGFVFKDVQWEFDSALMDKIRIQNAGQQVSFFGPGVFSPSFFSVSRNDAERHQLFLDQPSVMGVIGKYRKYDQAQAGQIAFILGGVMRHMTNRSEDWNKIEESVGFVAEMTKLGGKRSGEAVAAAIAMYVISGGPIEKDKAFDGAIYKMTEAIEQDPITPQSTEDLGLSQVARLRSFIDIRAGFIRSFPDLSAETEALNDFPTVGAEFHFSKDAPKRYQNFWQRLALLNMSQYQRGSYIQFSRDDRGIIEVRMNPSSYPVTVANWNHIRNILPELNETFFTITFNRKAIDGDFYRIHGGDEEFIQRIKTIGLMSYATKFESTPKQSGGDEVNFGTTYLGQTVRMNDGEFAFTGAFSRKGGSYGQIGLYTGFGDNLDYLSYYPSMALLKPEILQSIDERFWAKVRRLGDALSLPPGVRRDFFGTLQRRIDRDPKLRTASEAGQRIIAKLTP